MDLGKRIAEAIAKRVDPQEILKMLDIAIKEEVKRSVREEMKGIRENLYERVEEISKTKIEPMVEGYLNSTEFQNYVKKRIQENVDGVLEESSPVLILRGYEMTSGDSNLMAHLNSLPKFDDYEEKDELKGPIGVVNAANNLTYELSGTTEQYRINSAFHNLKIEARKNGGNVVKLISGSFRSATCFLMGELYVRGTE